MTAFHVELQSSFFAVSDTSCIHTQWFIDSGASKHLCFDNGSFEFANTFVSRNPPDFFGVIMGNGSFATVYWAYFHDVCVGKNCKLFFEPLRTQLH